jgi:hypothetical protein
LQKGFSFTFAPTIRAEPRRFSLLDDQVDPRFRNLNAQASIIPERGWIFNANQLMMSVGVETRTSDYPQSI